MQVIFRRRFRRRCGRLWCRARSGEGSGEGLGRFGAEPGQVQQGSGEGSGEGLEGGSLWCSLKRRPWSVASMMMKYSEVGVMLGPELERQRPKEEASK